jgi:MFS transporter, BCD family, chlorophyll transporter
MGLWGAAQALAFGAGGLLGTGLSDISRALINDTALAYATVFGLEALLFIVAARLASQIRESPSSPGNTMTQASALQAPQAPSALNPQGARTALSPSHPAPSGLAN